MNRKVNLELAQLDNILEEFYHNKFREHKNENKHFIFNLLGEIYDAYRYELHEYARASQKAFELDEENIKKLKPTGFSNIIRHVIKSRSIETKNYNSSVIKIGVDKMAIVSNDDWSFGDTKLRSEIVSKWFENMNEESLTLIFTVSWKDSSWKKLKSIIDSYTNNSKNEVVIIEMSEDNVVLRYDSLGRRETLKRF
ncbi:hypothetical protein N8089_02325 [Flavobacteriales bacterium]|nr:hypothetical protein [Flavobacteriales bacterium]